jgi:hypothetical protein
MINEPPPLRTPSIDPSGHAIDLGDKAADYRLIKGRTTTKLISQICGRHPEPDISSGDGLAVFDLPVLILD